MIRSRRSRRPPDRLAVWPEQFLTPDLHARRRLDRQAGAVAIADFMEPHGDLADRRLQDELPTDPSRQNQPSHGVCLRAKVLYFG